MKRLSNGLQYDNPYFNEENGNYLIGNGFKTSYQGHILCFYTDKIKVAISGPNLDMFEYHPEMKTITDKERWVFSRSYFGIDQMDMFVWMMLMHVMGIANLRDFAKKAQGQDKQIALESKQLVTFLIRTQITGV